jgi:hypothetical protein
LLGGLIIYQFLYVDLETITKNFDLMFDNCEQDTLYLIANNKEYSNIDSVFALYNKYKTSTLKDIKPSAMKKWKSATHYFITFEVVELSTRDSVVRGWDEVSLSLHYS